VQDLFSSSGTTLIAGDALTQITSIFSYCGLVVMTVLLKHYATGGGVGTDHQTGECMNPATYGNLDNTDPYSL